MKNTVFKIDFETSIGSCLGQTVKLLDYHLQEAFDKNSLDLTKEQMLVLKKIQEQDGISQNELVLLTCRNKSSLARLLSKMECKNYIKRIQSADDKRNNEVFITPEGAKVFARTRPIIKDVVATMECGISPENKILIIEILKKIQRNFKTSIELK